MICYIYKRMGRLPRWRTNPAATPQRTGSCSSRTRLVLTSYCRSTRLVLPSYSPPAQVLHAKRAEKAAKRPENTGNHAMKKMQRKNVVQNAAAMHQPATGPFPGRRGETIDRTLASLGFDGPQRHLRTTATYGWSASESAFRRLKAYPARSSSDRSVSHQQAQTLKAVRKRRKGSGPKPS